MGLFDSFFKQTNNSNYIFDYDTIIGLTNTPNIIFKNARGKFLKISILRDFPEDLPEEFWSKEDLAAEEEFNIRYMISYGIISLAIIEFLIKKRTGNYQNLNNVEKVKKLIFSNILKLRGQILNLNRSKKSSLRLHDDESEIEYNDESFMHFSKRISELATEIKNHFENGSDFNKISQYFGLRMGQILPRLIDHKDIEEEFFVRRIIKEISQNMETYVFNQL